MKVSVPFEIVAEEGEGGVGENGRIRFALIDELFQFFHFFCVHCRLPSFKGSLASGRLRSNWRDVSESAYSVSILLPYTLSSC